MTAAYNWMSRSKGRGFQPKDFAQVGHVPAYAKYLSLLREANAVDFDGLLTHVRDLMANNRRVTAFLRRCHPYMLVDEYQDSNPLQASLSNTLLVSAVSACFCLSCPLEIMRGVPKAHTLCGQGSEGQHDSK